MADKFLEKYFTDFYSFWPEVKQKYLDIIKDKDCQLIVTEWFNKSLEYNVPFKGKKLQGILTVEAYKRFSNDRSEENIRLINLFAWCIEIYGFSGYVLIDDIQDEADSRYGLPTWHEKTSIGIAINDALIGMSATRTVLENNFKDKPYYSEIQKIVDDVSTFTWIGQQLDMLATKMNVLDFTMEMYDKILSKFVYASMFGPIGVAWHMAGKNDSVTWTNAEKAFHAFGKYYQVENDFYGCFGDSKSVSGDIQQNKCTWLAVMAVEKASEEQRVVLKECYGSKDPVNVQKVKTLYEELDIPKLFEDYKHHFKQRVGDLTKSLPEDITSILLFLLNVTKSYA